MTDIVVSPVPKHLVLGVWPEIVATMKDSVATTNGKFSMDDVLKGVLEDVYVLWCVFIDGELVASLTTRIIPYAERRGLAMDWIGGTRMREWLPAAHDIMQAHAKANGCTHLEGYGRKAWGRWLAKYGWEPEYIAYKLELDDGQGK